MVEKYFRREAQSGLARSTLKIVPALFYGDVFLFPSSAKPMKMINRVAEREFKRRVRHQRGSWVSNIMHETLQEKATNKTRTC